MGEKKVGCEAHLQHGPGAVVRLKVLAGSSIELRVHEHCDGPVVHEGHLHMGSEAPAASSQTAPQALVQRLRAVGRRGLHEARAVALPGVGEQGELTYAEQLPGHVGHRSVHPALLVLEDSEREQLASHLVGLRLLIVAVHAHKHEQTVAYRRDLLSVHCHGGTAHPLNDGTHRAVRPYSGSPQAIAEGAVVVPVGAHAGGEHGVVAGLIPATDVVEGAAQAEVGEVVHRRALHHRGELRLGLLIASRPEVGAPEGLADGGLVRLERAGPFERYHRRGEVASLEQRSSALKEVVDELTALLWRLGRLVLARFGAHWRASTRWARIASTSSSISRATSVLALREMPRSPARVRIVTSLSVASKPMSPREMSLSTTASSPLPLSFARALSTRFSPCSAAKPTSVWSGRRAAARVPSTSAVGSRSIWRLWRPPFLILFASGAAGRKSEPAAAISSTSASANAARVAASSSSAVSTRTTAAPSGGSMATFAATNVTSAPRRTPSAARATPMRPDERFPTKRTESMGSRVPPAVTSTRSPSSERGRKCVGSTSTDCVAASTSAGSASLPGPHSPCEASDP